MENKKNEIINQIRLLLSLLEEQEVGESKSEQNEKSKVPVMLTIPECVAEFKGLSTNTVRMLCLQDKVSYIRAGTGKHGKFLVNRDSLLDYLKANG